MQVCSHFGLVYVIVHEIHCSVPAIDKRRPNYLLKVLFALFSICVHLLFKDIIIYPRLSSK